MFLKQWPYSGAVCFLPSPFHCSETWVTVALTRLGFQEKTLDGVREEGEYSNEAVDND